MYPVRMMRSLFFMLSCLFLCNTGAARSLPIEEDDMALKRELKMLNKPYVKSFKDKYGGIFDCVDMHKQPAFDHPLLKNHKIQISSPSSSSSKNTTTRIGPMKAIEEEIRVSPQESCPDGTVLLRRTLKQDLVKASASLPRFRQVKDKDQVKFLGSTYVTTIANCPSINSYANTYQFLMADDYRQTGCLNVLCPGFVVLSQTATPGMVLPTGTAALSISKDGQTGNWQVFLNQQIVGYFPKEIINNMAGATQVQMGGIAYAPPGHKSPPMGTGVAPVSGKTTLASTFRQAGVQGANIAKHWVTKDVSDPAIYNVVMVSDSGPEGNAFQFGGPGGV